MKNLLTLVLIILFISACSEDSGPSEDMPVNVDPTAAILIFPHENSECTDGTDLTDTESTILFEWQSGENTDVFEIVLENILTGETANFITSDTKFPIRVTRGEPFSWYVISKSDTTSVTMESEKWKFYSAGIGRTNYAPFPAKIVEPLMAATISAANNSVNLDWEGADVDDDIVAYDLFFGTTSPPGLIERDISESEFGKMSIDAGKVYFWKIITRDSQLNTSDTGIFQFKVE